ncbi:MAG: ATP-binding cassette domain-containing protein [Ruminococcus sp.]
MAYILEAEEEDATDANNKPALTGDICFRNVSFAYSLDHPILKNINFTIPAGSTFAILGTTGSGKSTLVHLLNRLYDLPEGCGSITIGGTDIRDIDRQYLRQNIGMVLQEPFLFSRTIRENIGITKEKLLDEGNPPRSGNCLRGRIHPAFYRRLRHHCGRARRHLIRRSEAASGNCPHADEAGSGAGI